MRNTDGAVESFSCLSNVDACECDADVKSGLNDEGSGQLRRDIH